jgi:sugar lactone lactonase YvrE
MIKQSAGSAINVCLAVPSIASINSRDGQCSSLIETSQRGGAWEQGLARFRAALMIKLGSARSMTPAALAALALIAGSAVSRAQSCSGSPSYSPDFSSNQSCFSLLGNGYNSSPAIASFQPASGGGELLQVTPDTTQQRGYAWYKTPQPVGSSFSTTFTFQLTGASDPPADGFAFVIQNSAAGANTVGPTGSDGCGLGFGDDPSGAGAACVNATGGITNSVAVGFKTFNSGSGLPSPDSVFIANNGSGANCVDTGAGGCVIAENDLSGADGCNGSGICLADGNVHTVTVTYTTQPSALQTNCSDSGCLDVILDGTDLFPHGVSFSMTSIGLTNNTAYVGFTGATGGAVENNDILSWVFSPQSFGEINVCTPGATMLAPCSNTLPVTLSPSTGTINTIQVVTQGTPPLVTPGLDFQVASGGTCATGAEISADNTCTVNVTFAPIAPGLRLGAVQLLGISGTPLGTTLIYGVGEGPAVAFSPGTQTTVNTTPAYPLSVPNGVAVDAAGDVFISDSANERVVKVAANGAVSTIGTGVLQYPQGLALDGAGDLFIADNNLNEVVEFPPNCTTSGCQSVVPTPQCVVGESGFCAQLGVAVDGAGNIFVASFNGEVLEVPANGGTQTVVYDPSGANPIGLAVDAAGDLFIADYGRAKVIEIPAGCTDSGCWNSVGTGWEHPEAVAVDAAGDVFVADEAPKVVEVPAGCVNNLACQITISGTYAYGVAVDGKGNVYIPDRSGSAPYFNADNTNNQVIVVNRSQPPSLSYGPTNVGTSTSPQSVALQNIGNQTLDAISPGLMLTDTSDFSQVPGSGTPADCVTTFSLVPGAACNLSVEFDPQSSGTINASAEFFDNALNNPLSSQSILLNGTGVAVAPPNYTLTVTETGSGPGGVTSGDGSITCPYANGSFAGMCSQSYASGTGVTLTATPTGTATFLGWGGACSGTNPTCTVTMSSAMNVSASFSQAFGSVNVCASGQTSPSPCNSTLAVTFNLTTSTTIGVVQVVTQGVTGLDFAQASGGTCSGSIAAGNSCYVNVSFTPLAPGLRMGAVNLFDNNGNLLGTALISGVGQAPEAAFGPGTQTTVASGLAGTSGVTVDAAGDVFISDNAGAVKVTPSGVQSTVPTSGISSAYDVAVDGAGDVFLADTGNNRVVEVTPSGVQTTVPATGLSYPTGVAVDGSGDVFITDVNNNRVVKVTPSGVQTTVPTSGVIRPYYPAVDGAGDVYFLDSGNERVLKVTPGGIQSTIPTSGLAAGNGVAVDAAGDVFITDQINNVVLEVTPSGVQTTLPTSGLNVPAGVAVDGAGDVFIAVNGQSRVVEVNRSQPPSLNFALTAVSNTSADSPHLISLQNVGNQTLTGTLALTLGSNFTQNASPTCGSGFSLNPGASCYESFSFTPQTTGLLSGAADFSDNTLNLAPAVVLQAVNLNGSSSASGSSAGVVPNVVGMTQSAAATALTTAGLTLGTVTTQYSDSQPAGSVIGQNPAAGGPATLGTAVALVTSVGVAPTPAPNPLSLLNNYFVTGDYAAAGVRLRGTGTGGMATGTINIHDSTTDPGVSQGVPDGADIIDGYLYWETLENTPSPSANTGTFLGFPITGQQIGSDLPFTDGALTGTLRVYRADVNTYFPVYANGSGVRYGSGAFTVSLPDSGGSGFPVTEGASLVVIYRVLSPNFPLKSVVIYDGSAIPTASTSQSVLGIYDALGGAAESTILSYASGAWNNSYGSVSLAAHASQYSAPLNAGTAYGAVIFSTPVTNSDNDGILDAWKSGPPAGDFFAGQPGYYDVKTQSWVPLPGAQHGEKDLFVQLDYMCGAVLASGACDPSQENLFPSPDAQGNDPLAIVKNSFAAIGIVLHLEIGNAVPESTCTDNPSASPPQLCEFPGQPGVVDWKNSLEISKVWPRNFASCAAGGDCTARFPYGQKDSYHYVLFGHSLAIPAWNTPYQTLTSITVASGATTIVTANRGAPGSINYCPSRFTISGVQGNPSLNGIYNTSSCPDGNTIILSTPGVPNWTYPNSTLPEPEIGLTSGTVTSISGYSDLGGQDSAVTLGLWETAPNQNMSTRANVIAGTFFHEVGHTVGLTHGGRYYDTSGSYIPTYEANCKPNFQSTMNYLFQLDGVGPTASVAFSNQTLATLLPGSLGSVTQLTDGMGNPATFPTSAWYTSTAPGNGESAATMHCDGTPLTGDTGYRINGSIAPIPALDAWSNGQNITFDSITTNDGVSEIEGMPYTQLRGYNDVANIDLRQVGATGGEFASLASVLSFASPATPVNIAPGGNVTLGAGGTVALGSGGTATLGSGANATLSSGGTIALGSGGSVTLNNGGVATLPAGGGTIALGSGGTVALGSGGVVTLSSAGIIALGSGGTVVLGSGGTVTLGSGGTIALGSGGTVTIPSTGGSYTIPDSGGTITLGSGGTVALGSGGTIALGSGGTIALGSGGTVALGSGGTVALGSGGTIALGSGGIIALGSGGNVTLSSGGTIALGSGGTIALGSGGTVALGSGGTVALGSGGSVTIGSGGMATLGSGGTVALGSGGTIALGSGGSITLSAGGTIALGSGGTIALGSGGTITLGSGGTIALGSGGITLSGGGTIALGSGGTVALGSGGTVALGSGGVVALGSGGVIALGSGGTVALGSGGTIALGSGGTVALGSGGATTNELDFDTANSIVRPPPSATYSVTPAGVNTPAGVQVSWMAPAFGVVQTYTISRSVVDSNGNVLQPPTVIGSVSGIDGNPPATTLTDTNPPNNGTVVYTIATNLVPDSNGNQRQSPPSPPAVLTVNQTIVLGTLQGSYSISSSPVTVSATAESNDSANGLLVSFSASGTCTVGNSSIDTNGVSSASVTLTSTGSCTITATAPAGSNLGNNYNAATPVSATFAIIPQNSSATTQVINFPQLPNVLYGTAFTPSARDNSGLPITYTTSGPCNANGTTTGIGQCMITAWAPSGQGPNNTTYNAVSVTQSFTVYPAVLTVMVGSLTSPYGQIPSLTNDYTITGYVNGESASVLNGTAPALSTTATSTSSPAIYPITVSIGSLAAANYKFAFVPSTLTIGKAAATVTLGSLSQTYTGSPLSATETTNPTGLTVNLTYNGSSTPPTAAGNYTVAGTVNNPNYQGSATGTLIISKAVATVTLAGLSPTYTGSPLSASATTTPAGLTVNLTYNGSSTPPTAAGNYTVVGTVNNPNYQGSATGTMIIGDATATINVTPYSVTYNGNPHTATGAVSGVGGVSLAGLNLSSTTHTAAGTYTDSWTFMDVTGDYNNASGSVTDKIIAAPLTITASSPSMIYGGPVLPITPIYAGFVNNEGASNLTAQPICTTLATSLSPVGAYASTCSNASDSNYSIGYAPGAVQVNQASTTIAVASSSPANTSTFMQSVTFTATVTPQYSGTTPTGAVTFYNNGSQIETGTLSLGQATFSTSSLPDSGPDSITAVYSGDGNFRSSQTSSPLVQTVNPAPNVSLSPLSVAFGNQNVNTTSSPMTITLTNNGDAPLNISSNGISINPSIDTQFAETNTCGTSVAPAKSCTISITFKPADTGMQTASLQIADNDDDSAGAQQVISITGAGLSTITGGSLYSDAVFARANGCGSITGSGGSTIDSFNSTLGYSSSHVLRGGNVGTNGNVSLSGGSVIYGSAAVDSLTSGNCSSSAVTGDTISGGASLTAGLVALKGPITYPAPPAPNPAPPTTSQNLSGSCPAGMTGCTNGPGGRTVTLAPGSYGNVQLSGGTTADFSKGTYNFNSLVLSGGSTLSVVGSGPVVVNLAGVGLSGNSPALDLTGGTMENPTGIPAQLQFIYAGSQAVNLSGGTHSYAVVYAPNALVNMSGGADFFGSVNGSTVTQSGGARFHYDSSLPSIQAGNYIWFNAVINNVKNLGSGQVKLYLTNSTISFTANGTPYNLAVPNAVVTFNSASQSSGAKTIYDLTNNRWSTSVSPSGLTGNTFITAVAFPVPVNFPTGIQNVTWSAAFTTDAPGVTLQWQWGAAVYPSSLGSTYATSSNSNVLGVNAEDGSADANGTDLAGTPETYKTSVIFGATGGGGMNYTGYFSPGAGVVPTIAPMSISPSSLTFSAQKQGTTSAAMTAVLTNNDVVSHTISSITIAGTNAADFAPTNNCPISPNTLASGASCTISVTFTPGDVGTRTAKVVVNDDANNSPQTLYLSGTGQ